MSQINQFSTITELCNAASSAIFKFQTGRVNRDELYGMGVELTFQFNHLVDNQSVDFRETKKMADFLQVIKHFSTC